MSECGNDAIFHYNETVIRSREVEAVKGFCVGNNRVDVKAKL